jgi:hypothetical protein
MRPTMVLWLTLILAACLVETSQAQLTLTDTNMDMDMDYGTCDACHCIPSGADTACPAPPVQINVTELVAVYKESTWENPIALVDECDPYNDYNNNAGNSGDNNNCTLGPPPDLSAGACLVQYSAPDDSTCPELASAEYSYKYTVQDYAGTVQEAIAEGLIVTHSGPCGTCSSLQDLAVYLKEGSDLRLKSTGCAFRGIQSQADGIACFEETIGFSRGCAVTWFWNTVQTIEFCGALCTNFTLAGDPNNGSAPECTLAECLQCDEDNAGPVFKSTAGRTRRTSGLLSGIVRPCSEIEPDIVHQLPPACETSGAISIAKLHWAWSMFVGAGVSLLAFGC